MSEMTQPVESDSQPPWLVRLMFTPVSQVLRGRITGRMRPAEISDAVLPSSLEAALDFIINQTRLWRSEKREVRRELAAHFADGLAAGLSDEDLLTSFGDPVQAAKLIRRAKKRQRPFVWQMLRRSIHALVLIIVVYLLLTARFFIGRPTISHDYVADLNRIAASVPESERAWPVYREALLALPLAEAMPDAAPPLSDLNRRPRPGEAHWEVWQTYLDQNAAALAKVRQAASMPSFGFVVGHTLSPDDQKLWPSHQSGEVSENDRGVFTVLLPYLSVLRRLATTLAVDVERAAAQNDSAAACADIEATFGIARHVRETPVFISDLVSLAIVSLALKTAGDVLANSPQLLSDEQLQALAHRIAAVGDEQVAVRFEGERLAFLDFVQRAYTDDGSGGGRLTPEGRRFMQLVRASAGRGSEWFDEPVAEAAAPALGVLMLGRRDLVNEYNRLMDAMQTEAAVPLWRRGSSRVDEEVERMHGSSWDSLRRRPLALLFPALSKGSVNAELARCRRDATLTAIALELHRRRHGAWPGSLDDLVPSLLPSVPPDRFDGKPLRYRLNNGAAVLYSIGTDRDDDGGEPPRNADGSANSEIASRWMPTARVHALQTAPRQYPNVRGAPTAAQNPPDGDWVLWPPFVQPLRTEEPDPSGENS